MPILIETDIAGAWPRDSNLFSVRLKYLRMNKAKLIGRKQVFEIGSIVTPDTLLRWYRQPVAKKYEGSITRKSGRPKTASEIE